MKAVGIIGSSGMAREAGDVAWAMGFRPVYVANDRRDMERWTFPGEIILESDLHQHAGMEFVIGIGDATLREKVATRLMDAVRFTNLIHPSATFGHRQRETVASGQGIIICAGARLTNNIQVGNFTIINQNACVAHDVVIESYVHVSPAACVSGNVHLAKGCWVGAGAVVNQGQNDRKLHIGSRAIIGSGSVVTSDCDAGAVYAGVPARRLK